MRVKLQRKKITILGSFTVKVWYVKTWDFFRRFLSCLALLLSWLSPFGLSEPEKSIQDLLKGCRLLGQASEICLKSLDQNVSHEETFFYRKRIYFPNVFFILLSFFISIVFFKGVVGGGKLSMLMIFRIWALYYA